MCSFLHSKKLINVFKLFSQNFSNFQLLNLNIHINYQKFHQYSIITIIITISFNFLFVFLPWLIDALFFHINGEELWNGLILQILLCSITIYLTICCFVVLIIREYFRILNDILVKNSSKEIFRFHLEICEVISIFNRIFSVPFGYFNFGFGFCTTFALFELFDIFTSGNRNFNQILFSLGFSTVQFHYAIIVFIFFICCTITMNEKEKALEIMKINHGKLNRNFVNLLQLEATRQKFTCGVFDFDLKNYYEVKKILLLIILNNLRIFF